MSVNALHFQKLVQAISLTLIHSLWQGLIAAVLAGMILMLSKKAKPALRYNLLAALLFMFVGTTSYTFLKLLFSGNAPLANGVNDSVTMISGPVSQHSAANAHLVLQSENNFWVSIVMDFCSSNAEMIVALWFVIFAFKSFQATAGFIYLQKIKRQKAHPLRESWQHRVDNLANKLKINQLIRVIESENVLVPMVIGFVKPLVIIPIGIFVNLPETQIEAIILHELAHIKRRDYLVNLIQIFCENVFFFNPALLWLSGLIREEREHCCDDLAISVMENKTSFVHALVSFQEYHVKGSAFEMAFSKKRNHLLDRIKRIIYNNNKPLNAMEKLFVTISLLIAVALSAAIPQDTAQLSKTPVAQAAPRVSSSLRPLTEPAPTVISDQDTLPKKKKDAKTESAVPEEVEVNANTNVHINVDANSNINVNGEGINTYAITTNGKHYEMVTIGGEMKILRIDGKEIPQEQFGKYESEIADVKAELKKAQEESEAHRWKAEEHREAADVIREQSNELRIQAGKNREQAEEMRIAAGEIRAQAEVNRVKAEDDRGEFDGMQDKIINDLKDAGVIKSNVDLSYQLNDYELVINGQKQPEALHQKLKQKYVKDKNFEIRYNNSGKSGSSTGVQYKK